MKSFFKHTVLAIGISICLSVIIAYINYTSASENISFASYVCQINTVFGFVLSMMLYYTNYFVIGAVDNFFFKQRDTFLGVKQLVYFASGIVITVISYYVYYGVLLNVFFGVSLAHYRASANVSVLNFMYIVLIALFVLLVVLAFTFYAHIKNLAIKNKQIEVALKQAEINSLKEQLSPHFLFNNLNVLISIIQEDSVKAEQFVRSFVKIYRYVIEQIENSTTTIEREIQFAKEYMYLMNVRYDNAIDFQISKEVTTFYQGNMLALSMQAILDNVLKHNAIPTDKSFRVSITIENGAYIVVTNDKIKKVQNVYSSKLGLKNLHSRYQLECNKQIVVLEDHASFSVKLPICTKEANL